MRALTRAEEETEEGGGKKKKMMSCLGRCCPCVPRRASPDPLDGPVVADEFGGLQSLYAAPAPKRPAPRAPSPPRRPKTREDAAADVIQRFWRRDPITLARITRRFTVMRHGVPISYDAVSLFRYILLTGDLRDPLTRQRFTAEELERLETVRGLPFPGIVGDAHNVCGPLRTRRALAIELLQRAANRRS